VRWQQRRLSVPFRRSQATKDLVDDRRLGRPDPRPALRRRPRAGLRRMITTLVDATGLIINFQIAKLVLGL